MRSTVFLVLAFVLCGCESITNTLPPNASAADIIKESKTLSEVKSLPPPMGQIPVSVYAFRDQTGQYKPSSGASSFSTAVTQGATSILVQTLSETSWFLPVEREGLQNILTERKIIRADENNDGDLPPLTTARIIIEGGVISYDTNIRTGGAGVEYFGVGASELFREDLISIYMRAVDVRTGQVLISVSTSKKVLSQEVRAGLFRYVSLKRLLEAETGYTTNEPMFECVKQGIEKAVTELVLRGMDKGVWRSKT
ncbi:MULTISPECIES: CsgG/HfaB family protein [unclassified Alteromonas]|jgi:curli production assembly/transport component CsgG|uniref:CsgG/HfaB family protein n=1 Tax=unclassified Alteromonas TaxID=2614992 RepID=UPI000509B2F3|nr:MULTISPECIES: CsgG/HfaB family protein [unclassified Alteromonas]